MVKPDIKHNYYADLELPPTACLEDIRKAYRKLALQYHPDRNSGREDEVTSKFQAIQAANEVLGDASVKEKYDNDRRKAGLYGPSFGARVPTPGNPYSGPSAYPPPPRRTQPGQWQRPASTAGPPPAPPTNGADRFSNFPRPTAKKDAAQDRTNMFRAWQNMNTNTNDRPRSGPYNPTPPPPNTGAARPPPPPPPGQRFDPRGPQEDKGRPGSKYKVPPPFDPEGVDSRSSAWQSFHQSNAGQQGTPRSTPYKTPNRRGFNPNAPGSDERPAPFAYSHGPDDPYPSRPEMRGRTASGDEAHQSKPPSPSTPRTARPGIDPQRPYGSRVPDDQVPYAEGNRERTPYVKSFHGEQPDFLREGLRRAYSYRDASKLSPNDASNTSRARSSSPHRPRHAHAHHRSGEFGAHDSSDESEDNMTHEPEEMDAAAPHTSQRTAAPSQASPRPRLKKTPIGPSRRFANGAAEGAQSDNEQRSARPNMYAQPFPSSTFVPTESALQGEQGREDRLGRNAFVTGADELFINATRNERSAFFCLREEVLNDFGDVPNNLDMSMFFMLVEMARRNESSGDKRLDRILKDVLPRFDLMSVATDTQADKSTHPTRFSSYPHNPEAYGSTEGKSRSEENINTTFSPGGWQGSFVGDSDYLAPPNASGGKQPVRRPSPHKMGSSQQRSATLDVPSPGGTPTAYEEVPQRLWGSAGTPNETPRYAAPNDGFDEEEWRKQFRDSTWTFPPAPPNPPSPGKGIRKQSQSRKSGRATSRKRAGSKPQPPHLDADDTVEVEGVDGKPENGAPIDHGDAMDIDDELPATNSNERSNGENGARNYSMQPSEWRQQHEQKQRSHRKTSSISKKAQRAAAAKFDANLDDLRNTEPLIQRPGPETMNVADLGTALPFQSQASNTMYGDPLLPRNLEIPSLPKAPSGPQRLTKTSWQAHAAAFGEYVKEFHRYNTSMLQHFQTREQHAQAQISSGMGWLEATGDTSGMLTAPTGFGTYMRGVKEDRKVREAWMLAWEKHTDAILDFEKIRDRVRKLVVGGMLVEN